MRSIKAGSAIATGLLLLSGLSATAASAAPASAAAAATATAASATTTITANAKINGTLYYVKDTVDSVKFFSYRNGKLRTVLNGYPAYFAEFSPDGKRLAYVTESGRLRVSNPDGTHVRNFSLRVAPVGFGPNWTANGKGLIVARASDGKAGVVQVSNGRFTALPRSIRGIHYRMTGDGKRYLWSDGTGGIWSARIDGTGIKRVPVLGKNDRTNPKWLRAYDIVSTNRDGSRITVHLLKGDDNDGDIGSGEVADTVVDTTTGKPVALPVRGPVSQVLYLSNGELLVRSGPASKRVLTLLSAKGKVLVSKTESAALRNLTLRDYLP
jgi:WD40 repeat protein